MIDDSALIYREAQLINNDDSIDASYRDHKVSAIRKYLTKSITG